MVSSNPIHWLCSLSDRYLTGDDVQFCTTSSARALLMDAFGPDAIREEALVRPWSNNVAFLSADESTTTRPICPLGTNADRRCELILKSCLVSEDGVCDELSSGGK